MSKTIATMAGIAVVVGAVAYAGGDAHWGYSGHEGPEHWGELSEKFKICGEGKNQSPINITGAIEAELPAIEFNYGDVGLNVVNNGHTIKVIYAAGSSITVAGHTYNLLQFHFHTPSENNIEGKSFPMEAHLVHADDAGNLAVVAVMFTKGAPNSVVEKVWVVMPSRAGEKVEKAGTQINVMDMLPPNKDHYRFNGSLTTPPCSEGVVWMVLKDAAEASKEQVEKFSHIMHHDTNRPVQPVNARPVLK
jgi:carbonic anhydrase